MKKSIFTIFLLLCSIACSELFAQTVIQQDSTYIFEMKDGNTYIGKVNILEKGRVYELSTSIGKLSIRAEDIEVVRIADKNNIRTGTYWPKNPHSSRYFFSPSGYGLRKGEGYYQNAWIFFNQVSYGFSDYFTMGVGMIPTFLFGATEFMPIWITPKFNFEYKNGKGAFGAGSILFTTLGENGSVGILYGSNTFGTRDKQLTIGLGWGYSSGGGFSNYPTVNVSGLIRTSKKWAFVTENYFLSVEDGGLILSAGARYMAKNIAIDLAGARPVFQDLDGFFIIPWLSISVPFGKKY
ncbi:MAG: hypothetical protein IPL63_15205 [Saprospiraceae bacterium]|nr:hypothetical protein [Saprospiraceae bacterium]MBK6564993.1 hypothetical protein [Saprospiraceae bacterium]MBK7523630.1 hypothetical protein [Saprospiraceae bacterium]MBK8079746.1 hypothetical protein [Saprospiraceae bacterium]MBK8371378.1 hypothetical protein [Saprospiraceae bacterium]